MSEVYFREMEEQEERRSNDGYSRIGIGRCLGKIDRIL